MEQNNKLSPSCPIRTTMEMLGGKWRLIIINTIGTRTLRYGEIKNALPEISEKMLVQELNILVDNDLLYKQSFDEVPLRVEYSLTENGYKALQLIEPIKNFGLQYQKPI